MSGAPFALLGVMRIFTWHVHGSYLYYLTQDRRHDFFLPVTPDRAHPYGGRAGPFAWGDNVHEIPIDGVKDARFDVVISQSRDCWLDRLLILSADQLRLPRIHIEHDPPRESPTDTRHFIDERGTLLVHVTPFNRLMWDCGRTPTRVIEHGVAVRDDLRYTGELERGIVVVNGLLDRGRRLGADVFERVRAEIPLDLAGMKSESRGGLGDLPLTTLWQEVCRRRFFFNPIRYTSLGLAVCEAMMLGVPIVALATTEMATVVSNGICGWASTSVDELIDHMRRLLRDRQECEALGAGAQRVARERFSIRRFLDDWDAAYRLVT